VAAGIGGSTTGAGVGGDGGTPSHVGAGGGGHEGSGGGGGAGYGAGGGAGGNGSSGGGGSSFVAATATIVSPPVQSSRPGDGQVTISYDPSTDSCPIAPAAVVAAPRFTG
jgi:hypothetical protein